MNDIIHQRTRLQIVGLILGPVLFFLMLSLDLIANGKREMRQQTSQQVLDKIKNRVERFCAEELGTTSEQAHFFKELRVVSGSPAETIVQEAENCGADLIIVGSDNSSSLKNTLLGSTARKVTHMSRKPVLVVPMSETETWD